MDALALSGVTASGVCSTRTVRDRSGAKSVCLLDHCKNCVAEFGWLAAQHEVTERIPRKVIHYFTQQVLAAVIRPALRISGVHLGIMFWSLSR